MRAVCNTAVLIALERIGRLELLEVLFDDVVVPDAVAREYGEGLPRWVRRVAVGDRRLVEMLREVLHVGEAEAIALALEVDADVVLLDDKRARLAARRLGLRLLGTVGVLVLAKKRGLITSLEDALRQLVERSFWLSRDVVDEALERAKKNC
ncbi:MAG: DUF3368 domain-containing protein [Candidatus Verstraetearchaeota archaeon]|nr:DUF3368 domain-containing protein [Candidatus Verstraetearchaeota archaeon]